MIKRENVKVAIVGCGNIAKVHAQCINKLTDHNLVAVADICLNKAIHFAANHGGRAYRSLEEMLAMEEIDVLHICTPHYLHVGMAEYALRQGVHVFMEKPAAIYPEELKRLKGHGTEQYLGFCFQNRYNRSIKNVREFLESGRAGNILGARGMVTWARPAVYYTESDWRGKLETEGGGALINQSIHTLDLIHYLIDEDPVSVDAVTTNHHLKGVIEVEDTVSSYITYAAGISVCFYVTTAYVSNTAPLIELECEKVRIRIEQDEVTYTWKDDSINHLTGGGNECLGKNYWGGGHEDCINDFYACIVNERRFLQDIDGIEDTMKLVFMIYQSAKNNEVQYWKDWK